MVSAILYSGLSTLMKPVIAFVLLLAAVGPATGAAVDRAGAADFVEKMNPAARFFVDDFLPAGSPCTRGGAFHYPKCMPGLWCIGKTSPRCTKRVRAGGACGDSLLCVLSARCVNNRCQAIARMPQNYLPLNALCKKGGKRCFPGLWCVVGQCRRLVPCGGLCGFPTRRCRPGLRCRSERITRKKVCARIHGGGDQVRTRGQQCFEGKTPCRTGLVCVKRPGGACSKPGEEGRKCSREFPGTCKIPARLGQSCGGEFSDCESGRQCYVSAGVGAGGVGKCRE